LCCRYIGATISDVDVDKVSEEFGGLKIVSDGSAEQFMAIAGGVSGARYPCFQGLLLASRGLFQW
jgi:hypothetical protein